MTIVIYDKIRLFSAVDVVSIAGTLQLMRSTTTLAETAACVIPQC